MSLCLVVLLINLLVAHSVSCAEPEGRVRASLQSDETAWVGQPLQLNLDLLTTGYSFSDTQFNLPEVSGAFLMQTDTTTIKLTETINGKTWQIVRYPLALFPQKAGEVQIPPIAVRFSSAGAFGDLPQRFELQTEPQTAFTQMPPGVHAGDLVVSTADFELEYEWEPPLSRFQNSDGPDADIYLANIGDAITLTVTRRAASISGMLLRPLPVFEADGLGAYPRAPEINDQVSRGSLTGIRTDRMTWVIEQAGQYQWPEYDFQWWDPASKQLRNKVVASLNITVNAKAIGAVESEQGASIDSDLLKPWYTLAAVAVLLVLMWIFFGRSFSRWYGDYRANHRSSEKAAFKQVSLSCRKGNASECYGELTVWLGCIQGGHTTLSNFASNRGESGFIKQSEGLQRAMINPDLAWNGDEFLQALKQQRKTILARKSAKPVYHLPELNPRQVSIR